MAEELLWDTAMQTACISSPALHRQPRCMQLLCGPEICPSKAVSREHNGQGKRKPHLKLFFSTSAHHQPSSKRDAQCRLCTLQQSLHSQNESYYSLHPLCALGVQERKSRKRKKNPSKLLCSCVKGLKRC